MTTVGTNSSIPTYIANCESIKDARLIIANDFHCQSIEKRPRLEIDFLINKLLNLYSILSNIEYNKITLAEINVFASLI